MLLFWTREERKWTYTLSCYEHYIALRFAIRRTNSIVQCIFFSEVILCHSISSFSCICNSLRKIKVIKITAGLIKHQKKSTEMSTAWEYFVLQQTTTQSCCISPEQLNLPNWNMKTSYQNRVPSIMVGSLSHTSWESTVYLLHYKTSCNGWQRCLQWFHINMWTSHVKLKTEY